MTLSILADQQLTVRALTASSDRYRLAGEPYHIASGPKTGENAR